MGYTHYFNHEKTTTEKWDVITNDIIKLIKNTDVPLANSEGKLNTKPEITNRYVSLNGVEENSHEQFVLKIQGSNGFCFCKTANKPYDLIVCACLIIYKYHSADTINITSDGDIKDWSKSIDLIKTLFDYGDDFELD
jgi:hypothetical protein